MNRAAAPAFTARVSGPGNGKGAPVPPAKQQATTWLVHGITLLVTMGISSLLPVLPVVAEFFSIPLEDAWGVIAAFTFPGLLCVPFVGVWADRYGRKPVLVPALLLFAGGGFCCALAGSYTELLFWRFVQGMGAAPLGLLYPTIIADTWQGEARVRAMGGTAMTLGLGTAISPALGGALAMLDWRLPFLLPLLALPLTAAACFVPLLAPSTNMTLPEYMKNLACAAGKRQTATLLVLTLLTFFMLSGPVITCFPMLTERYFHASPWQTGALIASASLASGLAAKCLTLLYRRLSSRSVLLISAALYCAAFGSLSLLGPAAPALGWLLAPMFLYGLAQGLNIPLVTLLLSGQVPESQRAALLACNAVLLRLGQNLGPAAFGTLAAIFGPAQAFAGGIPLALAMAFLVQRTKLPVIEQNALPPFSSQ